MVTNNEFLTALFGVDAPWVHVTDFPHDPGNIPKDQHLIAWKGDYFSRYPMQPGTNQYFTISNFYCDDQQQARRRKALFRHTPVIVLDDVKEKLSMSEVSKLPTPSWILESSQGSEQWGYILDTPCTDRAKVENLLDGLVANGLAPDGKDPGMKGVTRYVRLPEGFNSKATKLVNGMPYKCQMLLWEPFNRVTIEQLAAPFAVDLNKVRRESRVDGAAAVSDHPLINIPEIIHIKEVRSDGRFDIKCPWVQEHTNEDDDGSAVFTNSDGSVGFKCHHGSCQGRTGKDLLRYIDGQKPEFSGTLKNWQIMREFSSITEPSFLSTPTVDTVQTQTEAQVGTAAPSQVQEVTEVDAIQALCDVLRRQHPTSAEGRETAASILKYTDDMPKMVQLEWHNIVCDIMGWGKGEFKEILKDLRKEWYDGKVSNADFYDKTIFVKELTQFYDWESRIFFSTEAFQNSFSHEDAEARKIALQEGRVQKVDRLDYAPKYPRVFVEEGITYANTWVEDINNFAVPGDVSIWRDHIEMLGWGEYTKHIEQWMAFTMRHPDVKINHMMIFGGGEGVGKDFILYPLAKAMGHNYTVISGEELLTGFNDYALSTKYLHINEAELGDRREAIAVSNKLKPLAAAPPDTLRVNQKGIKPIKVRNILNATMTTNSQEPIKINGVSRRFLALWSDLKIRDHNDTMKPEWLEYWNIRWPWMKGEGWKHIANYLMYTVDLTGFNPAEAPPMTDFMRDIRDSSKSPMQLTVEAFIRKGHGAFACDIASSSELCNTLRSGEIFSADDVYVDTRFFTPTKVGLVLRSAGYQGITVYNKGESVKMWVLKNREVIETTLQTDLYENHLEQMNGIRRKTELTVIK